jgi:phytoene dehydrogenase-like protein
MADYDVIVIGAGHNGMAAAATLAKQGMRVVVFEKQGEVGGMAATRELFEGYRHNVGAWALMVFDPQVMKELELKEYGLEVIEPDTSFCNFGVPGEKPFILYNSLPKLMLHLTRDHGMDAMGGLKNVFAFCAPFVDTWKRTRLNPPPSMGAILEQATSEQERDMLRKCFHLGAMDIVQEFFPDPEKHKLIQVMLAGMATDGTGVGPYDPGTAFSLVYHLVPAGVGQFYKLAKGGMGAVSEALKRSFEDKGGELRLRTPVERVLVEKGKAVGVVLKGGETIRACSPTSMPGRPFSIWWGNST